MTAETTAVNTTPATLLERLLDTSTVESRVTQSVVTGVATAALSPSRMSTPLRKATHAASGFLGAVGGALAFAESPKRLQVAAATGFGGALVASSVLGLALDRAAERWLRDRGMKHPRLLIGAAAGVFTYATSRVGAESVVPVRLDEATPDAPAEDGAPR